MSSTHPSQLSSPDTNVATKPSTAEPINSLKHSWVWVYFSSTDEKYVHCNITNASGKTCNKKLKHNKTGSTKALSWHLNLSHRLTNLKSEALVKGQNLTLNKFVKTRHVKQQEAIWKSISNSSAHVSFTTDTWTSPNIIAYMAVTAHFMDEQFNLTSLLLGLSKIEG
ncbi:hypothetical protein O181_109650, partial [Austropuccinia psidii MF-1]|nr:hypothetical protein [Austropuccinia psidii MF-1]